MSSEELIYYEAIDGAEGLYNYAVGGYHPVMPNDVLNNRYRIVDKLGYGGYATIWLARDLKLRKYVALKIGMSDFQSTSREIAVLRALSTGTSASQSTSAASDLRHSVPKVLDAFEVEGPNGTHTCYTLALAQGNLSQASFSELFPLRIARGLAAKLALAVSFVHSQGFIHGGESTIIV